ncbi:hypothetical protein SUGI_1177850 [Cryptomeria japonica]|uniref:WUSCHEL-related homeobox 9-like n=1 Tax=Cryptomeria japonica TaxID=3369 RepID=UPI0024147C7E|nr:WUSCHEL-related homeobox 9-like [Cryptomeria japonica]GLJ54846.1 hypothetical protein SUGI_1177850 [Cryptomeria japonica]
MAESMERYSAPRWKPTAEQLEILEELYKKGSHSPNTEQIHRIADCLMRYGEIQAKNVFYWFQNRKGSERLGKRKRLHETMASLTPMPTQNKNAQCGIGWPWPRMQMGLHKETEANKKWSIPEERVENVELVWPANINSRNGEWSMDIRLGESRPTQYTQYGECEHVNETVQTLQLFPLNPTNIGCKND